MEKNSIETKLTSQTYYSTEIKKEIAATAKRLKNIHIELETLEERWLEISEKIELAN